MLFAYGLNGLWRQYLNRTPAEASSLPWGARLRNRWDQGDRFDCRWTIGCAAALGLSLVAWLVYAASQPTLRAYLETVGFDRSTAQTIAAFSTHQVGWFVLFFLLGAGVLVLVLSGVFTGPRARWGSWLLGLLVVVDLGRANLPWLIYWRYEQKYASNDVIRFLQQKPYEHRVAVLPFTAPPQLALFNQLYEIEWKQQLFPYYNIQCLDIIMLPRAPVDYVAFESALSFDRSTNTLFRITRRWQLTNTRYLLGAASSLDELNQQMDPVQHRFRPALRFDIAPKPGYPSPTSLDELTAVVKPDGQYAVFEFTGALPRARLYSHWQVSTNDQVTLEQLGSPAFDPERTVLVNGSLPASLATESAVRSPDTGNSGTVEFVSYASKEIVLETRADFAAVLLLNDRFDAQWKVTVDGQPATLLRCNYIMRGVQLAPGAHRVRFSFHIPIGMPFVRLEVEPDTQVVSFVFHVPTGLPSYITLSAYGIGLILLIVLALSDRVARKDSRPGAELPV